MLEDLEKKLDPVNPKSNLDTKNLVFAKREAWVGFKTKISIFDVDFLDIKSVDDSFDS